MVNTGSGWMIGATQGFGNTPLGDLRVTEGRGGDFFIWYHGVPFGNTAGTWAEDWVGEEETGKGEILNPKS